MTRRTLNARRILLLAVLILGSHVSTSGAEEGKFGTPREMKAPEFSKPRSTLIIRASFDSKVSGRFSSGVWTILRLGTISTMQVSG